MSVTSVMLRKDVKFNNKIIMILDKYDLYVCLLYYSPSNVCNQNLCLARGKTTLKPPKLVVTYCINFYAKILLCIIY